MGHPYYKYFRILDHFDILLLLITDLCFICFKIYNYHTTSHNELFLLLYMWRTYFLVLCDAIHNKIHPLDSLSLHSFSVLHNLSHFLQMHYYPLDNLIFLIHRGLLPSSRVCFSLPDSRILK